MGKSKGFSASVAVFQRPTSPPRCRDGRRPQSPRGMIDVSARGGEGAGRARVGVALCGGGGMLPLLTPPNQSIKRLDSPCRGALVGRVMGQGEPGLRENVQPSFREQSLVFRLACGLREKQKAGPGVSAGGGQTATALTPSQGCDSAKPQPAWVSPPAQIWL